MSTNTIAVTTHVSRDLLQSAALFKHEHTVVWEYVANGLEYIDPGVSPIVKVRTDAKAKKISIADNGRGMDWNDLGSFFVMHGENIDRKQGRAGRGMFGTGKSAALGVADLLRVTTVKSGKRSVVELNRRDVEAMSGADDVPVKTIEKEANTSQPNGTLIEIEHINLRKIDPNAIIRHVERHIAHWPNATVFINNHECEFVEPPVENEYRFSSSGTPFETQLGNVELVIKVAKAPLEEELQGVAILSKGVWHETTLLGNERKPFANYIFGEIDSPKIQEDSSPIAAFDMSRSMKLNPENPIVAATFGFVGSNIDRIRRELENLDKDRRDQEKIRKLAKQAEAISEIINNDFSSWRDRIKSVSARMHGGADLISNQAPDSEGGENLIFGDEVPAEITAETGDPGHGEGSGGGVGEMPHAAPQVGSGDTLSPDQGRRTSDAEPRKRRTGGFSVDFLNMGEEESRAKYEREHRTIYVNLDHPQIAAANSLAGIEDPAFRRLAYEVAFAEYAIALAQEMAAADWYLEPTDPIVDIRDALNRVSRAAAHLYAA